MQTTIDKIGQEHLQRSAAIYIRQSTTQQVKNHTASTQLQYDLRSRAISFGWKADDVKVYDSDLGLSGGGTVERPDFRQLVADVGTGIIGIIFAFDATRLARNNVDWHRLLDVCSICKTLVADFDGVYDVSQYNDRLLLGLKGTMSEAEHHLIRTRLVEGMFKKAEKGELRRRLPAGLDYDPNGMARITSDEKIRHAIELVFQKFEERGSGHQVYRYLQERDLQIPIRRQNGSIDWQKPDYGTVMRILKNPRYSGAYVYGRTVPTKTIDADGVIKSTRKKLGMDEWKIVIKDQYRGYITWEQFVKNQKRLQKNILVDLNGEASVVVRNGTALLHGLIRCGVCGRRMAVAYHRKSETYRYVCSKKADTTDGAATCQSIGGPPMDRAVSDAFLDAMEPANIEIAVAAVDVLENNEDATIQQLRDRLEEARYEADRAFRQYNIVEPENRIVARTLETEWNARLKRVEELEEEIERRRSQRPPPLSEQEKRKLKIVGLDLNNVWNAPTTDNRSKKQLLQVAFESVFARVNRKSRVAELSLVWEGGAVSEIEVKMPRIGEHSCVFSNELIADIRKMATCMTDKQIAKALNNRGARTPKGLPFSIERVRSVRRKYKIPIFVPPKSSKEDDEKVYTAQQAALELGVCTATIFRWIEEGFIEGEQVAPYAPWKIRLPEYVRNSVSKVTPEGWLPIRKAAHSVGVSRQRVLHWIQKGELDVILAGRGRRRGLRVNLDALRKVAEPDLISRLSGRK